jgi:hypothetical protein
MRCSETAGYTCFSVNAVLKSRKQRREGAGNSAEYCCGGKRSFRIDGSKDKPFLKFKLSCATFLHHAGLFT